MEHPPILNRIPNRVWIVLSILILCVLFFITAAPQAGLVFKSRPNCRPTVRATFSTTATSVTVWSTKDLSNVVLKFCDGSPDQKYEALAGKELTFSAGTKELAGVWIKSGCNHSADGPGYGEFVGRTCSVVGPNPSPTPTQPPNPVPSVTPQPTPSGTVTPTGTPSPTSTPTPSPSSTPEDTVQICHIRNGVAAEAYTISVPASQVESYLDRGDSLGACPIDCMGLPFGQAQVDLCGICGGDNSSCKDCAGVPNGGATVDQCGVCGGNNTTCIGCDGKLGSGKFTDACGVCGGDGSSCLDCAGTPNGGKVKDLCGVCGGNNSTCKDCAGTPNGSLRLDACGVCGGDGESCVSGCSGKVDSCGVCNGKNACLDCAGIPNGGTKIDCCGVCGGKGDSCPELCKTYRLKPEKTRLLKAIKILNQTVSRHSKRESKCAKSRRKAAALRIRLAKELTTATSRDLKRYVPGVVKVCNTPFCVKTSVKSVLSSVKKNLRKLNSLSKAAQRADIKYCGKSPHGGGGSRAAAGSFKDASSTLGKIPNQRCDN